MLLIVMFLLMILIFFMGYMMSIICRICVMCINQQLEQQMLNKFIPEVDACPVVESVSTTPEVDTNNIITTDDIQIVSTGA